MEPVWIGITTSFSDGEQSLELDYVRAITAASGMPLLLPVLDDESRIREIVDRLDGLIIPGGPAVTTGLIGNLPDDLPPCDPLRWQSDTRYAAAFLEAGKPILGICYGMQLLNALAGGTIYADVQHQVDGALIHSKKRGGTAHDVLLEVDSTLYDVLKVPSLTVNTRHIQAIAEPGRGYRVSARATDGVIEAIENESGTVLGLQFHPEKMPEQMAPLFKYFVDTCRYAPGIRPSPP